MKIEWSLAALADLDRIQEYIEQESPPAAERVWARIYTTALHAKPICRSLRRFMVRVPLVAWLFQGPPISSSMSLTGTC